MRTGEFEIASEIANRSLCQRQICFRRYSPLLVLLDAMSGNVLETAGFGVGLVIDDTISTKTLMDILERKISNPEDFLPVTDVFSRPSDDGLGT